MARKKSSDDAKLLAAFEEIDKLNPHGCLLSQNTLSCVDEWYDTGSYVLNAICSGSLLDGGIPKGRVVGFTGPSQCGKTYLMNKVLANAQKKGKFAVIFDSEIAVDKRSAEGVGLDPARCKYYPISTIEDCRNQLCKFLDRINTDPDLKDKFIVAIDSFGNLGSAKEDADTEKGKTASDMGQRAKALKSLLRQVTYRAAAAGCTVMFSNHIYSDPMAMYPSLVKKQSGGEGPIYMASLLCQLAGKAEEQDEANASDQALPEMKKYSGVLLRAITVKNRFIPPFLEGTMYVNYVSGPDKYYGLEEMAIKHGILDFNGKTYILKSTGEKLGFFKQWRHNEDVWKAILPQLDKSVKEKYRYGAEGQPAAPELEQNSTESEEQPSEEKTEE